jgi:large subunit ribosomal protein L25
MSDALTAAKRTALGKSEVKKLRSEGLVPGVVYGKGRDALPVQFPLDVLHSYLSEGGRVVDLAVEGRPLKALVKEVQHDIFTDDIVHIDFQVVSMTEKITLPVAVVLTGELPFPPDQGTLEQLLTEIVVECLPKDAPEQIQMSISELEPGGSIHVSDVEVPAGVRMVTPEDEVIASVVKPTVEEEVPEAEEEEAAEPEVIGEVKEEPAEGESE